MKETSISTALFLRTQSVKKDGTCPVYLRVIIDRKAHWINLNQHVAPQYWKPQGDLNRVKREHPRDKAINILLNQKKNELDQIILRMQVDEEPLVFSQIKARFLGEEEAQGDFIAFVEEELQAN